jgi:hypothetical protein
MNKTPHKWQKEIIAWANGERVQYRNVGFSNDYYNSINNVDTDWKDFENYQYTPAWHSNQFEYRIKPKEKIIKYRVVLMKKPDIIGEYYTVTSDINEEMYAKYSILGYDEYLVVVGNSLRPYYETTNDIFVKWLTDIIEVKVEEK